MAKALLHHTKTAIAAAGSVVQQAQEAVQSRFWKPFSRLCLVGDGASWVLSWEMRAMMQLARKLGITTLSGNFMTGVKQQAVFYADQFCLSDERRLNGGNRIGFCYYHGIPTPQDPQFGACYETLKRRHRDISRVQVTNSVFKEFVLGSGIAPEKVHVIPVAVNLQWFKVQTPESRHAARARYGLPQEAAIIGTIQKDGVGWGDGMEPKLIKGPDIFIDTVAALKSRVPDLFVLVCGPARGFVINNLKRLGVAHKYIPQVPYPEVGEIFQALDLYLITARDEGGPKAVLESMASGVPLVTSRVGQAVDLVKHGQNGWMADVGDMEGLAHWSHYALMHREVLADIRRCARQTAEANTYDAHLPLWRRYFEGFVEHA